MRTLARGAAAALSSLLALPLTAQDLAPLPQIVTAMPQTASGTDLDIAPLPRALLQTAPKGALPPVPIAESGLPQPDSKPVVVGEVNNQGPQAGQFTFFRNRDHRPAGASLLFPGEPSACADRDTYFATGNTYGSLSKDSGMTWTHVNPVTLFPQNDGGVCCDQRVLYDPGSNLTLWYIQHWFSSTTGSGGFRLAWANARDNLRASNWQHVYFNAASFGLTNQWLDFPDIAISNNHFYFTTNVFNASSSYTNSIVGRIALADLTNGGGVSLAYYLRSGGSGPMGGGASYRFTQTFNGAPSSVMYWASHNSTSSIRIFRWDDGASVGSPRAADVDRSIPSWTSGAGNSTGPDGRNWIGFDDHRIASGYVNPVFNEAAFIWSSNANGGSRPQSYVRVQVFDPGTRNIISTEDVFNATFDFGYPAVGVSSLGHGALVMTAGSATSHVTTFAMIVDNYFSFFQGNTVFALANGANGSPSNRWGDYHSVVANPIDPRTFIITGMEMASSTSVVHRTAWIGRDDYTPAWVTLSVGSVPNGAFITVDETDRNGNKNGTTPFSRSFTPQQSYRLTAPASFTSGGNTFLFDNWTGTAGGSSGVSYLVNNIGTSNHTATANYRLQMIVTVDDRNVAGSVPITVGTADLDGRKDGSTSFTRRYKVDPNGYAFTAPALAGNQPFRRWYVNGTAQPTSQQTIVITSSVAAVTIEAEYCNYVAGSYATYGSGCLGSNGQTPLHGSTSTPDLGASVTHTISRLRGATPAVMFLGFSKTTWNGTPLPLCLGFIGANPSCCILTEVFLQLPIGVDVAGNGSITFSVSSDPAALGVHTFTQVVAADIFVPDPLKIVVSNGLDMTVGGSTIGGAKCP
jgi:hypothetical protein